MATAKPIVYRPDLGHNGPPAPGDTIDPVYLPATGSVPVTVANGVTFAVAANTQVFARQLSIEASGEVTIAADAELVFT